MRPLDFGDAWFQGEPNEEFIARQAEVGLPIEFTSTGGHGASFVGAIIARQSILRRSNDRLERRTVDRANYSLTLRNITERKALEDSQRRASEAALVASEAKSQFLANMSNGFRMPLNTILGFTDMMRNDVLCLLQPFKYREYVEDVHVSGEYLCSLLGDLLDLSKIEAGQQVLKSQIVRIRELITVCLTIVEGRIQDVDRLFTFDVDLSAAYV